MAETDNKGEKFLGVKNIADKNRAEVITHLQMIQDIVERMARCSFWIKGWTIALVVAVLAVMFRIGGNPNMYLWVVPIVLLGCLDAYYLWQERCFRGTYDIVRMQQETDFAMKPDTGNKYIPVLISKTIFWFYFTLCGLMGLAIWSVTDVGLIGFILGEICNG